MKLELSFLVCAVCIAVVAEPIRLKRSSNEGFDTADGWEDGGVPEPGKDYLVDGGFYLRGDYSEKFLGDSLQFGVVGGTEGVFFKEHKGTHEFKKLILANGYYRTWMSRDLQDGHICGSVEVVSPESAPFRLHSSHDSGTGWWLTYWDASFSGAEGTGLKVGPHPNALKSQGDNIFTGDNSSYLGSFDVYGSESVMAFTQGNSLGGALSAFKADAIALSDGVLLEFRGTDATLAASLNRGITVNPTGGRIGVEASDATLRLEWPICGSGTLVKEGAGTLVLASEIDLSVEDGAAAFAVTEGDVQFAEGFSNVGGMISVSPEGSVSVRAGDEVEVDGISLSNGVVRVYYDETTEESGVLTLGDDCTFDGPVSVYPPSARGVCVPFLKVPVSLRTVTADDFVKPVDLAATGLPTAVFEVKTEDGYQVVYLTTCDLIHIVDSNPDTGAANNRAYIYPYWSDAWMWSNGKVVQEGLDYFVGAGKYVYSTGLSGDCVFAGGSITFAGTSTDSRAIWKLGSNDFTGMTADVRAGNYARFFFTGEKDSEFHLRGRLHVDNTEGSDRGLDFRGETDITAVIDSVISGSGYTSFQVASSGLTNTFYLTADNTFTGTYFMYGAYAGTKVTLKFARAECFGPNPSSYRDQNFLLQSSKGRVVELYPEGSQTISQPNREFVFSGGGAQVKVDDGEVFELNSPVRVRRGSAVIRKEGGGTWAVGGAVSLSESGDDPIVTVAEGFLRADNPRAFVNLALTVEEDGGIAAKYRGDDSSDVAMYGMIVTNSARFAVNGDTLKFKVSTGEDRIGSKERIALLTVPEETAAVIDGKRVVLEHDDVAGRNAVLEKDAVSISSIPCVRYSCRLTTGFNFILR